MDDRDKTYEQLIEELNEIRRQLEDLKLVEAERKRLEEIESRFRVITHQMPIKLWSTDTNLRLTSRRGMKREPDKNIGHRIAEFVNEDDLTMIAHRRALDGESSSFEVEWMERDYEALVEPLRDENEEIIGAVGVALDITERKRAEKSLAAEKECLELTFRSIGDGVIATDAKGRVVMLNRAAERLTGWSQRDAAGKHLNEIFYLVSEKDRERRSSPVEEVLETGKATPFTNHTLLIARDGMEYLIRHTAAPIKDRDSRRIGVVLAFRDITEERKIEEEMRKASKLESIGVLAGGIAHNFNNYLTAILGNVSLAMTYARWDRKVSEKLQEAEQACVKANDLARQLFTFARGGAPVKKAVATARFLDNSACFALTGSNVRCETALAKDMWPVEIDEGQMSQVIHNVVRNAQEAMPSGGTIYVEAKNLLIEEWTQVLPLRPGRYVKVSIQDQGAGIAQENLCKIFDPYFTTREGSSGLGLATCYSIIKNHDGLISVESKLGAGTIVHIYIPASEHEVSEQPAAEVRPQAGRGRVLVMDDEEIIRKLCRDILTHFGYEPVLASDGAEAIETYRREKEAGRVFDAVILDLTVPGGMGGKETIKRLREIDPNVKAIVSSGYSNDPVMAEFREYGFDGVVAKPYQINDLARALSNVLDATE